MTTADRMTHTSPLTPGRYMLTVPGYEPMPCRVHVAGRGHTVVLDNGHTVRASMLPARVRFERIATHTGGPTNDRA
jgi:hypothetical protein